MKKPYVWVIEISNEIQHRWEPCSDCSITKKGAMISMAGWKKCNPSDIFHIQKYERVEK